MGSEEKNIFLKNKCYPLSKEEYISMPLWDIFISLLERWFGFFDPGGMGTAKGELKTLLLIHVLSMAAMQKSPKLPV